MDFAYEEKYPWYVDCVHYLDERACERFLDSIGGRWTEAIEDTIEELYIGYIDLLGETDPCEFADELVRNWLKHIKAGARTGEAAFIRWLHGATE